MFITLHIIIGNNELVHHVFRPFKKLRPVFVSSHILASKSKSKMGQSSILLEKIVTRSIVIRSTHRSCNN